MLAPGTSLGPYEIVALIGAGGMGEVYKARDPRLDRTVAIKIASEGFTERFEREARAVAAFNHPHICQLYDIGPNYLVMELVDGEPVKGPMPVEKAIACANQILDALAAAHRKGIIHRDLKPANILLTKQGIKLLDFGLAKREGPIQKIGDETVTAALTGKNQIVGTLQYMAPEQLQNQDADARSDLFAFGCVLYEMLSGKRAFAGESAASVIGAILHREPEPLALAPPVDRVIRRCLAKDPDDRFQSARDLQYNLALAMEANPRAAPAVARHSRLPWIAAALLGLTAVAASWALWRSVPEPAASIRMSDELPAGYELVNPAFGSRMFAVSPDGGRLAVSLRGPDHRTQIQTRLLRESNWKPLEGSEGGMFPFFSPDGAWIGFVGDNKLKKLPIAGGTPTEIGPQTNNGFRGASWAGDGTIFYSVVSEGLRRIPASGGPFQHPGKGSDPVRGYWPQVLPGGKSVLLTEPAFNIDGANIFVLTLDTGELKTVHQ
jgi:predicted Ser/Thr protein kinase